ncbi:MULTISPECIES: hypothetical protein [Streptomyces]|uniref:Uncharacterized protein n=2 Tax=Streptomyces TaxID=1883 RepID=A0A1V0UGF6_STRVN|nr:MULTISPECIES: hypothetical protein [Streptomyces]ARF64309.1 hypothetical protein B1H20_25195 [Streptomyces violaceoruber]KOG81721.1 hypothetical protein ADK33_13510 [Streptomyces griseus subsp. rhodochrous]KOU51378.1 hypothetical protein ADK56_10340 [Streptomyces sp. MMG1522]
MMSGLFGAGVAQASTLSAHQSVEAKATKKFSVPLYPNRKSESSQKFTKGKTGKVKYTVTKKGWNHAVGFRLVTCKGHKSLTEWIDFKKKKGDYYTFKKSVKKGTCFKVQAGRSWAQSAEGKVNFS